MDKISKHRIKLLIYAAFTVAIMLMIFLFSAQSANDSQDLSDGLLAYILELLDDLNIFGSDGGAIIRKIAHFCEFFALGISSLLLMKELMWQASKALVFTPLYTLLFCFLYACSDELHQFFVPGRSCQLSDALLDLSGSATGILFVLLMIRLKKYFFRGSGYGQASATK